MKSIATRLSVFVTGSVLLAFVTALGAGRLEYCGQPETLRPQVDAAAVGEGPTPTLAPPMKVVVVRVEADKADLEIGWAEN